MLPCGHVRILQRNCPILTCNPNLWALALRTVTQKTLKYRWAYIVCHRSLCCISDDAEPWYGATDDEQPYRAAAYGKSRRHARNHHEQPTDERANWGKNFSFGIFDFIVFGVSFLTWRIRDHDLQVTSRNLDNSNQGPCGAQAKTVWI